MPVTAFVKKKVAYDPAIARDQLLALQYIRNTFGVPTFCRWFFMILAKKEIYKRAATRLVPFDPSRIQLDLIDTAGQRNITLKPRQIGSTTWHIICRLLLPCLLEPGSSGLLISQTKPYGVQHFRILQRAVKNFARSSSFATSAAGTTMVADELHDHLLHTQYSARHEIVFDYLDSKVLVDTAENNDAGTGLTINHLVCTEVAYWKRDPESLLAQAKEAIPTNGTMDLESTPNGMGGYFFEEWQRSQNQSIPEFKSHFYPWWMQDEYQAEKMRDEKYRAGDRVIDFEKAKVTIEEKKMMDTFHWTMKQLAWRRDKQISLRTKFPEKYPEDAQTCFLTSGAMFFDMDMLRELKLRLQKEKPLESYHQGQLRIFKKRVKGRRYVIGADVAEGKLVSTDNPDRSAAHVLDIDTGEQVATYKSTLPPEDFAQDLVDLGQMYNNALLAIERNGPGGTVILTVQRQLLYGNIYYHKEWYREKSTIVQVAGFPTNMRTRPIALNKVSSMIRNAPEFIHSEDFINECLTFVWKLSNDARKTGGKRVPQGADGCHDDLVLAMAVAEYARNVILGYLDPIESASERYGQIEDAEEDAA